MICPCHLPLTLAIAAVLLGGTAAGAMLNDHVILAGVLISLAWLAGTLRGFWMLRLPRT